jgi:gamma-glutamylcyclotransferase (GGCT)/AIG2-like uncharacterized protein YtfP
MIWTLVCQELRHGLKKFNVVDFPPTLFVYGSLKPGELGYEQIAKFVSESRIAELSGYSLYVRDGLPLIVKEQYSSGVSGYIISIKDANMEDFWKLVLEYEGNTNYKFQSSIPVRVSTGEIVTGAFVGRKISKGNPVRLENLWSSKLDPIFSQSFPILYQEISNSITIFTDADHDPKGYWVQMNNLLSKYLLLVSILEHLTVVKFGGSKKQEPMMRIRQLQQSSGFIETFSRINRDNYNPTVKVADSRAIEDSLLSTNPDQALFAWYQVRSNLQHRGKASLFDAELVQKSCIGLANFLLEYLRSNIVDIEEQWAKILQINLRLTEYKKDF